MIRWVYIMFRNRYLHTIMQEVKKIRKAYGLSEDTPIGDYIFAILKNECILIEWPEDKQLDLDGFSTEKVINGCLETIVYINSAKSKEKQNFCAAHELGHRHKLDKQLKDIFPNDVITPSNIEDVMNRFAAELMMPARDFEIRSDELYRGCFGNKDGREVIFVKKLLEAIVVLMDFYYVPYKAVVLRLQEVNVIPDALCHLLLTHEETENGRNLISAIIREQGITRLRIPDRRVQYSVQLENIRSLVGNTSITKYMPTNELKEYLKAIGFAEEDIQLIEDMKKIESETISIDDIDDNINNINDSDDTDNLDETDEMG